MSRREAIRRVAPGAWASRPHKDATGLGDGLKHFPRGRDAEGPGRREPPSGNLRRERNFLTGENPRFAPTLFSQQITHLVIFKKNLSRLGFSSSMTAAQRR